MYSNIRIVFLNIVLLYLIWETKSDYTSAIRAGCPFRNGRVYIAYPNMNTVSSNRKITFDMAMTRNPSGVIIGIRTLQINTVNKLLYYYFFNSQLKQTGFVMIVNLTSIQTYSYYKLIVDYLVAYNVDKLSIYSIYPVKNSKNQYDGNKRVYLWELNTNKEECSNKQKKVHLFIYELKANFISNNYDMQLDIVTSNRLFFTNCQIELTTNRNNSISNVAFSGIIYTSGIKAASTTNQFYQIFNQQVTFNSATQQKSIDHLPFPTLFAGLKSLSGGTSNKIDFVFEYDSQYELYINNNFNYFQFNPRDKIKMIQSSSGIITYKFQMIYYKRQSCDSNFPSLNLQSQVCYNKFTSSQDICKIPTSQSWKNYDYSSCFQTPFSQDCSSACSIRSCISAEKYFNSNSLSCQSCFVISNCLECEVSGQKVICKKCFTNYTLLNNQCIYCAVESSNVSPYLCLPCNLNSTNCSNCPFSTFCKGCTCVPSCQSLNNCSSCFYFDSILKCVECNSLDNYLSNGKCHACAQNQYFDIHQTKCKACSLINMNCSKCRYILKDIIECTVCVNKTILNERSCSPCKSQQYFNRTSLSCIKCSLKILNCTKCLVLDEQVNCTKCQNNFILKNQYICQAKNNCTQLQYFKIVCLSCYFNIAYCQTCIYNPINQLVVCNTCLQASKTILVNNTCKICQFDQFFQNRQCHKCSIRIPNCNTCQLNNKILLCYSCKVFSIFYGGKCFQYTCNQSQYLNITQSSITCEQCQQTIQNCYSCIYLTTPPLLCKTCLDQYILKNNLCIPCQQYQYFNNGFCNKCNLSIPNCIQCIYQNSTVTCIQCKISYILGYNQCHQNKCMITQFLYITNSTNIISATCKTCNSSISKCQNCVVQYGDLICISCYTSSETVLKENQCRSCASYQYYQNNQCYSCNQSLSNCIKCKILDKLICQQCDYESNSQLNQGKCVLCNSTSYLDRQNKQCNSCSNLCIQCSSASNCTKCQEKAANKTNIYLQNGYCNICNSTSKHKNCNIQISCYFSKMNQQTGECQPIELTQTAKQSINMIASLPTLNLMSESFVGLVGLFDDLSYYYYHDRKFSTSMTNLLQLMKNASLSRLLMPQLQKMLQNMGINFNFTSQQQQQEPNTFLIHDLGKSPRKFKQNDNDVYFSKTSFKLWTGAVPTTIATFLIMAFLHYLINKKWQNQWFRKYSYLWMIITGIFGHNIQFISFKCFAQMYQVVPIDVSYNMNLIFCYFALLFITIYSITSIILIINQYKLLDPEYILQQLFYETWKARFIMLNLLKMILGFIHAYFYFNPLMQQMLLFLAFSTKFTIYIVTYKWMKNMFNYISLIIDGFLMLTLQVFFLVQVPMIKFGVFHGSLQHIIGQYQILLIALMIMNKVFIMIALPLKDLIINQIAKRILQNINLDLADITIIRQRVIRKLTRTQQKQVQWQYSPSQASNSCNQSYQNNQSTCQSIILEQSTIIINTSQPNKNKLSQIKKNTTRNIINKNYKKHNISSNLNNQNRESKFRKKKKYLQQPHQSTFSFHHLQNKQSKIKKQNKSHFQPQFIQKQQNQNHQNSQKRQKDKNEESQLMKQRRSKKIRKKIQLQQAQQPSISQHNIQIYSINDNQTLKRNTTDVASNASNFQYPYLNKPKITRNRIVRRINKQQQFFDEYFKQDLKINMFNNNELQKKQTTYDLEQL